MPIMTATKGQAPADAKADEIARLSWNELDAYGERTEQAPAPSGHVFHVSSRPTGTWSGRGLPESRSA